MICPHCRGDITATIKSHESAMGREAQAQRTTRAGWPKGKPRATRCPCGAMSARRAALRGHKCS